MLEKIGELLACPDCRSPLNISGGRIFCSACPSRFDMKDGVPLFARFGSSEGSGTYQQNYQSVGRAAVYNEKYDKFFFKRLSTRREFALLRRMLSSQPRSKTLLDLPCGGGRLSPQLAPFADLLIEADIAEGQILVGKSRPVAADRQIWMTASAFHLPFRDESVDGAVCVRLSHHLPEEKRAELVRELLRVAKRFVILTFFDYHSLKNWGRRLRAPFNRKRAKKTMTVNQVAKLAQRAGGELVEAPPLSLLGSGHRYALIVKKRREESRTLEIAVARNSEQIIPLRMPETFIKKEKKTLIWRIKETQNAATVVKLYRRRSLLRSRAKREFENLRALKEKGVPSLDPLFWGSGYDRRLGPFEVIATREEQGALPLTEVLELFPERAKQLDWPSLYRTLRRMHDAGVYHGALALKNILFSDRFILIDAANAIRFRKSVAGALPGRKDLLTFMRSLSRNLAPSRRSLREFPPEHLEALVEGYGLADGEAQRLLKKFSLHSPGKHSRNWGQLFFQLRSFFARCGIPFLLLE